MCISRTCSKRIQVATVVSVGGEDYNLETNVRLAPKLPFSRAIAIQAGSTG